MQHNKTIAMLITVSAKKAKQMRTLLKYRAKAFKLYEYCDERQTSTFLAEIPGAMDLAKLVNSAISNHMTITLAPAIRTGGIKK